jgi:hypothetical protein
MVANRAVVRRPGEQNPAYEPAHPHSFRKAVDALGRGHRGRGPSMFQCRPTLTIQVLPPSSVGCGIIA